MTGWTLASSGRSTSTTTGHVLGPRDRVVLSALAVRPGEVLSVDRLADALWHDTPPESWTKVVQGCVVRLRKALGAQALETTPHGYRLVHTGLRFDTQDFEALLQRGHEYVADGVPERAVTSYRQALGLWRGDPFEEVKEWDDGRQEGERLCELRRACEEELLAARIAAGERALTADAQALVKDQPWRERRWAILALAQYREGRQADALASVRRARKALKDQLGLDAGADLIALETAVLQQDPVLDDGLRRTADESCPWKGLAAYDAEDEDAFHGREEETEECLDRLERHPLLVLAGPSGCGKSSLMCAGIVAGLRARGRTVVVMVPGRDPALAMASALTGTRAHPVLVVDQFEEVFTLRDDGDRTTAWLAELAAYARDRAPVILAVRSDHVAEVGGEPGLARLAEAGLHLVSPLTGDRLRAAIEGPARAAGLRLEHGLVDLLLRDSEGEPGALPLLSHALAETWLRRDGRLLTVTGYQDAGGSEVRWPAPPTGSTSSWGGGPSEPALDAAAAGRHGSRRRAVPHPGGQQRVARRPHARTDRRPARPRPAGDGVGELRRARARGARAGLATVARVAGRGRLRSADLAPPRRVRRGLGGARAPVSELYRGARLEAADEWTRESGAVLTAVEAAFLAESRAQETSGLQALARRNREQAAQNRRLGSSSSVRSCS
jgi:DNA-binding SARP family transcriptional activator